LRVEERLDGASNFLSWKARVTLALKEYDLWELADKEVTSSIDPTTVDAHNKKEIKAKRSFLDSVKDHLMPHLNEKKTAKEIFDALVSLFQRKNMNRKMVLRNKLRSVQMSRLDNVTSYLMRFTQGRDQLAAIWGEK
jgi:transcription termination factor NusB